MRVQRSNAVGRAEITADADGLTGRAGVAALVELADRVGLTGASPAAARLTIARGPVHARRRPNHRDARHRRLRIDATWPRAAKLVTAFARVRTLPLLN